MRATFILALAAALVVARPCHAQQVDLGAAEVVLYGGKIWTVCRDRPEAQALAVRGGRIVAVGADADVRKLAGPATRVIDLQGRRVVPGFHDGHLHLFSGGRGLSQVDLRDAADEAEFGRRLREFDKKLPPD